MKKTKLDPIPRLALPMLSAALALAAQPAVANDWLGASTTTNGWSDAANWSSGIPPVYYESVIFGATGGTNAAGRVNNVVDANYDIFSLSYSGLAPIYHSTFINAGRTLRVAGEGVVDVLAVNSGTAAANDVDFATISGPGTLFVTNIDGTINVRQGGASGSHRATLDLSGLSNFTAVVGNVLIGVSGAETRSTATLLLAKTNALTTTAVNTRPGILLGRQGTTDTSAGGILTLNQVNIINTDGLVVGGHRANGANTLSFAAGLINPTLTLRGPAGGSSRASVFSVGDNSALETGYTSSATGVNMSGTADFSAGVVDIMADTIHVGRNPAAASTTSSASGGGTGTLTIKAGTVDANNLYIGNKWGNNYGNAAGTLNLNGGTLTVQTNIVLANRSGTYTTPTAVLNIASNALVQVGGSITDGGGTTTINISGGTIDMQPAGDATKGSITVKNLAGNGIIANGATVSITTALTIGGVSTPGTLAIGGNLNLPSAATLTYNLTNNTATSANDYLGVTGNITFNNNLINIQPIAPLATGTYRLVDYTGTKTGTVTMTNYTRYALTLDQSVTGQVNLVNAGGSPASLIWSGSTNNLWNTANINWNANTEKFYHMDSVTFNDAGGSTNVSVSGALAPQSITVNASTNYFFTNSGRISGIAGITKSGSGILYLGNTGGNDFYGPVQINAGTIKAGSATALGSIAGGTTIASGATLDVNNQNLGAEPITVSGSGTDGMGAIVNTGAEQQQATRFVTLAGNTTLGGPNRWDVRNPGDATGGSLAANGFSLVKTGANYIGLVRLGETGLGDITVNSGTIEWSYNTTMGDPAKTVTVNSNATLAFWNVETNGLNKIAYMNDAILAANSGSNIFFGPITLSGSNRFANTATLNLAGPVSGSGSVNKQSAGRLILSGANTYSGPTLISGGTLALASTGTLDATPEIGVAAGATFDASAIPGGFTLASGKKLSGSGTVLGNLSAGVGTTVAPGSSAGTLTFSNDLALADATLLYELNATTNVGGGVNDLITASNLSLAGVSTVRVVPIASLDTTSPYTLFTYQNSLIGGAPNLSVTSDSRYEFTVIDPATTPGSVQVQVAGSGVAANLTWKGGAPSAPNAWDTKITPNWLNGAATEKFFLGDSVAFDDSGLTTSVTLNGTLQPAAIVMANATKDYTFSGSGGIQGGSLTNSGVGRLTLAHSGPTVLANGIWLNAGTLALNFPVNTTFGLPVSDDNYVGGTLAKEGSTVLTLSGNNANFNGAIAVNGGILKVGNGVCLGTSAGTTTIAPGASLDVNGVILTNEIVTVSGVGFGGIGAIINGGAAQNNALHDVNLVGDTVFGGASRWDIRNNAAAGNANLYTSGQPWKITKISSNQVSIVAANVDFGLGDVDVREGLFGYETTTSGLGDPTKTLTVRSNATFQFWNNTNPLDKTVLLKDGSIVRAGSGTSNNIVGPVTLESGNSTLNAISGTSLLLSGPVSGNGGFTKPETGTVTLSGTNSFNGNITNYAGGTVVLSNSLAAGTSSKVIWNSSATGGSGLTGTRVTVAGDSIIPPGIAVSFNADTIGDIRSTFYAQAGTNEWQGLLEVRGSGLNNVAVDSPNFFTISGPITGVPSYAGTVFIRGTGAGLITGHMSLGSGKLAKTDASTWTIASQNNSWSSAQLAVGTLRLGANNALCLTAPLTFGQSDANASTFDMNGFNQTVPFISATGGGGARRIVNESASADSVFTFAGGTNVCTWPGQFMDNLTTNGTHKLAVTIASGTLYVTGANNSNTGPTTVTGGVLGGTSTLVSPVVVAAAGTLAPGATLGAIGTMSVSNTVTLGGTNLMDVSKTGAVITNDLLRGISTLTFGGTLQLNLSGTALAIGDTIKLFEAGSYAGAFASILPAAPGSGLAWDTASLTTDGTLKVVSGAAPEVSAVTLLPDGNVSFTLNGSVGQAYSIWFSADVLTPKAAWTLLTSGTIPSVPFVYSDLTATNQQSRFYIISSP